MNNRKIFSNRSALRSLHRFDNGFVPTANPAYDSITVTHNSPLISCVGRKRPGEYWIHAGSFIGGGGCGRLATAEEVADYLSQGPHGTVLMRLTKELGWEDVHRYLGLTKYGFVSLRLPTPLRKSAISSRSVALAMGRMFQRNILYRCRNCYVLLDEYSLWIRNNGPQQVLATAESHR